MSSDGSGGNFALIEMLFSFGVVLAIAIWQLWEVRPEKRDRNGKQDDAD